MDELQDNMEVNDGDHESAKSDLKLGRLQYKLDYDFNTNNVRHLSKNFIIIICII